ncbi:MAG: GvpL/GvpF family gas vesicle protein [Caldilineaceae bacterium]
MAQHPQIAALRSQAEGKSPQEVQQLQIAVGVLVKQLLDATREAYSYKIRQALSDLAADVEVNAVVNDQVVTNLALAA